MNPIFPQFKKLSLEDKELIENFTKKFPSYSDYNFPSLYSYNTENLGAFSFLNNNLVLLYTDYLTNLPFFSFLGVNQALSTCITLFDHANQMSYLPTLKLIPEICITKELRNISTLDISEDEDNFDYILSIKDIAALKKRHYNKVKQLNQFENLYKNKQVKILDLREKNIQKDIILLTKKWQKEKNQSDEDTKTELTAIKRIIEHAEKLAILGMGIYINNVLIGFSLADISTHYPEFHFVKALKEYKGIYAALYIYLCQELKKKGYEYVNIEQDLGIEGLRESKKQWHPSSYLKKYIIKQK